VISDVFARRDAEAAGLLPKALRRLAAQGRGVLIYLREGAAGVTPWAAGAEATEAAASSNEGARTREWREVGIGAQILRDLGVASIRLLATRQRHYVGLSGFGIDIVATELIDG
jgi:3,4-dihydroxy 2-butanone 4-phosphate synthase/GTP cyclohydrolase II